MLPVSSPLPTFPGFFFFSTHFPSLLSHTVWEGTPVLASFYLHGTVPNLVACKAVGFAATGTASTTGRINVCKIWYPDSSHTSGLKLVTMTQPPCNDNEPYIQSLTCSTACPVNCTGCSDSYTCTACSPGLFVAASGSCVTSTNCGAGYYANTATSKCEGE